MNGMNKNEMNGTKVKDLLLYGKNFLKDRGIASFQNDSRLLLMFASGLSKTELFTKDETRLAADTVSAYNAVLEERGRNKPMQYILGECEFMSLDFIVNSSVLIPRPDTEILAERAIKLINEQGFKTVLDMCTGSGCIAVSLGHYTRADITAADISADALIAAELNAARHSVALKLIRSDMFSAISGRFDIITANPPYIARGDITLLGGNVKDYEPRAALDGGADGLDFYRAIAVCAPMYLNTGGVLLLEIGCEQARDVSELLVQNDFCDIKILKDLAGLDRVVCGTHTGD